MKRIATTALIALLAAGCATGGSSGAPGGTSSATAEGPVPTPAADQSPSPEAQAATRRTAELVAALGGKTLPPEGEAESEPSLPAERVFDEKTGVWLERIPKSKSVFVKDGIVFHRFAVQGLGIPLVREDESAYYIEASNQKADGTERPEVSETAGLAQIMEYPASEGEVVEPPVSAKRIRLEESSRGLPKSGFWRTNFDVADLDGDGQPEIVTPPPRLTMGGPRIFKADGQAWKEIRPEIRDLGGARFGYGGVAVGDMDGDGKPDIVAIGHRAGLTILFNEGGLRFRAESRGLPEEMSGRALALGDLNGDGKLDIVAQSDQSEYTREKRRADLAMPGQTPEKTADEGPAGYAGGVDARYFLAQADGTYREHHAGLEASCYGYAVALQVRPVDGKGPFLVTSCRYSGRTQVLYSWDQATSSFVRPAEDDVEWFGYHMGAATGTYQGKPAAFVTYFKTAPKVAVPQFSGQGVSVYYRDGDTWKRRRVVKSVQDPPWDLAALAAGDLDGDGLDDVVLADDAASRLRIFFQTAIGGFEELATELLPKTTNRATSLRVADLDGDGRKDVALMYEYRSSGRSRAGGLRVFLNRLP
jgi:hypothetical protein